MELEHALFFNYSQAVLKLPTSIVRALHVDELDHVWFIVHRPLQNINEFEREFKARMDFYKKGKDFHLHVTGKACLVTDPEEINNAPQLSETIRQQAASAMVLIRLKIEAVEYFPHLQKTGKEIKVHPLQPLTLFKTLQYIVKDIIPVFQSH